MTASLEPNGKCNEWKKETKVNLFDYGRPKEKITKLYAAFFTGYWIAKGEKKSYNGYSRKVRKTYI